MVCGLVFPRPSKNKQILYSDACVAFCCGVETKFGLPMVVAVLGTISSFSFFYDLELLAGIVLRMTRTISSVLFRWRWA